ncbi:tafazzin-like [Watersipora subatra]|uniref:tafazzin-like n=1 Tax=Watersipora subatra TaxID=2589382 RepID=UPI00355C05A7
MVDLTKIEWPFKGQVKEWKFGKPSNIIPQAIVFGLAKLWMSRPFNNKILYNGKSFRTIVEERQVQQKIKGCTSRSLLTISNHRSCLDDPFLWGSLLSWKQLASGQMRWVPVAAEICFTNRLYSFLFGRGHCVPVVRGHGVYQQGMDFILKRLNEGHWVHIFPEGKVTMDESQRLKWGVGRLIAESKIVPDVIPIWHMGADTILPNKSPYIPRLRKTLAIYIGQPIGLERLVAEWKEQIADPMLLRKRITDYLEGELRQVKEAAMKQHQQALESMERYSRR